VDLIGRNGCPLPDRIYNRNVTDLQITIEPAGDRWSWIVTERGEDLAVGFARSRREAELAAEMVSIVWSHGTSRGEALLTVNLGTALQRDAARLARRAFDVLAGIGIAAIVESLPDGRITLMLGMGAAKELLRRVDRPATPQRSSQR
jgi:hypothetical protein